MPCPPSSQNQNLLIVSSTTRPTGFDLTAGKRIFEVDTLRELTWDGTGWVIMSEPNQTFTPVLTGMVVGAGGTNLMNYHRSDGWLDFDWTLIFGSSGQTFPTSPTFSFPVAFAVTEETFLATLLDTGIARYQGLAATSTASTLALVIFTGGASVALVTTTTPFTWGATDSITVRGRYRMTTRYS